jgi:hypothetical protein
MGRPGTAARTRVLAVFWAHLQGFSCFWGQRLTTVAGTETKNGKSSSDQWTLDITKGDNRCCHRVS